MCKIITITVRAEKFEQTSLKFQSFEFKINFIVGNHDKKTYILEKYGLARKSNLHNLLIYTLKKKKFSSAVEHWAFTVDNLNFLNIPKYRILHYEWKIFHLSHNGGENYSC